MDHLGLVELFFEKGISLNFAMNAAGFSGNLKLFELVLSKGANNFNMGLSGACQGGNINLVELMVDKGASKWSLALLGGYTLLLFLLI